MAAIPAEYRATLYDLQSKSSREVYLVGGLSYSDRGVGGGPIVPPNGPPSGAHPEHPIYYPPGSQPHPEHPIYYPPQIPTEPPPDGGDKPPPEGSGGWGFVAEWSRWGYFPGPGEAQPK